MIDGLLHSLTGFHKLEFLNFLRYFGSLALSLSDGISMNFFQLSSFLKRESQLIGKLQKCKAS